MRNQENIGSGINILTADHNYRRRVDEDFISGLARVVLQRLEEVEKESGLEQIRALPESRMEEETRQLLHGWDGLKSRLKWIAEGM